jgi:hypothetical protein
MALKKLSLNFLSPRNFEAFLTRWFWLVILLVWICGLGWLGLTARSAVQEETLDSQVLIARQERLDQVTLKAIRELIQTRADRNDDILIKENRFVPSS